jgi:serine/threonine protein kinase
VSLPPGSKVGPYEIVVSVGAGGMGEVYKARDPKLGRDVAIKVLPDSVAGSPDRLARFEREARALAALNHPNVAQIFGFEDGALVMELLEGETLRDRLHHGALPVRKAVEIASQIARGLAAAHERGIIHRDLKPENIFLLRDGQVKLLDFGLARSTAVASATGVTATAAAGGTDPGTVLGTVGYMSPEQVRAEAIDARTDLFSLGAVLYEMLSGERAFRRSTSAETMTAILREEPADLSSARAEVSPAIDRIVRHALEKNPLERFQSARDIAFALDALSGSASAAVSAETGRPRVRRERAVWAAITLALLGLLVWQVLRPRASGDSAMPYQLSVPLPDQIRSNELTAPINRMDLSHDGNTLAYQGVDPAGVRHMWAVSLRNGAVTEIPGAASGFGPVWSPDGSQLAFTVRSPGAFESRRVRLAGGASDLLAPFGWPRSWSPSGVLLFAGPTQSLRWIDVPTGAIKDYESGGKFLVPGSFLPDGRRFLVGEVGGGPGQLAVHVASLDSAGLTKLIDGSATAYYARGAIAFVRGSTLFAQRFDVRSMTLTGQPVTLTDGIDQTLSGGYAITSSPAGTLVLQRPEPPGRSQLQWFRRDGVMLSTVNQAADYSNAELSPDGRRLLVTISDLALRTRDVFIVDLERGVRQRLTFDPIDERSAVWSADGHWVYYRSTKQDLHTRRADFTGEPAPLVVDGKSKDPYAVSRDGKYLAYRVTGPSNTNDVMIKALGSSAPATALRATDFDETGGSFSPDGRSIAYQSDESGQPEVYVTATDGSGGKVQLSTGGGRFARWVRNGNEILYLSTGRVLMSVPVKGSGALFQAGVAKPLFRVEAPQSAGVPYDVSADGQRIIAITSSDGASKPLLTAIINWPALVIEK